MAVGSCIASSKSKQNQWKLGYRYLVSCTRTTLRVPGTYPDTLPLAPQPAHRMSAVLCDDMMRQAGRQAMKLIFAKLYMYHALREFIIWREKYRMKFF